MNIQILVQLVVASAIPIGVAGLVYDCIQAKGRSKNTRYLLETILAPGILVLILLDKVEAQASGLLLGALVAYVLLRTEPRDN
jgi:hypothetical protein